MPSRFAYNVNLTQKSVLIQHSCDNSSGIVDAVAGVLGKVEQNITNDVSVPTNAQLLSIAKVLVQLRARNIHPSILLLLNTCLNLVSKYKLTADKLVTTLTQLEVAQFKASLVDDIEKVKAYLLAQGSVVFPTQRVSVQPIEISESVAIHIQMYGLPIQLSRLAIIEQNLKNSAMTLPGSILLMIQQFVESFTY